jgi:hypothetical protein
MNVIDSSPTRTASEGRATVGKKRGDAPWAALRFALGYLMMPLWGGGDEKTSETVLHHHIIKCIQAISFNP